MSLSEQAQSLNTFKLEQLREALTMPEYAEAAAVIRACISCFESGMSVEDLLFITEFAQNKKGVNIRKK